MAKHETVEAYIAAAPEGVRPILEELRRTIREAAPGSGETISYQMPTVTVDGRALMYYAAWKRHVGVYPIPTFDDALEVDVAPYRAAKDTVRFPLADPIPLDLVRRVVAALVERRRAQDEADSTT